MKIFNIENFLTILVRVMVVLTGIVSSVITAHALGPKGRGELIAVMTMGLTVANFSNLGFPSSNTYFVAANKKLISPIFLNSLFISLGGGMIALLTAFFILDRSDPFFIAKLIFLFFFSATTMVASFTSNILVSINRIRSYNVLDFTQNLLVVFLYGVCFLFKLSVVFFLVASLLGTITGSFIGIFSIKKELALTNFFFDWLLFKNSFRYAIKVYITTFIAFFIVRGNIFLLQEFCTITDVGIFSIALQLYETIGIIPSAIGLLLFPRLIKSQEVERWKNMNNVLKQVAILMAGICIFAYFTIPFLIPMVFGKAFSESVLIAQILLPGAFFLGMIGVVSQFLASIGYPRLQVVAWLVSFIIWSITSLLVVPKLGLRGTAVAITVTNCLLFIMLYLLGVKKRTNDGI
jgi:antigen flippase